MKYETGMIICEVARFGSAICVGSYLGRIVDIICKDVNSIPMQIIYRTGSGVIAGMIQHAVNVEIDKLKQNLREMEVSKIMNE